MDALPPAPIVAVRIRPSSCEPIVNAGPDGGILVGALPFEFDHAFDGASEQVDVYRSIAHPLVAKAFDGLNSTLLAYGQTGSGKSHSMTGTAAFPGIMPRLVDDVFAQVHLTSPLTPHLSPHLTSHFSPLASPHLTSHLTSRLSSQAAEETARGTQVNVTYSMLEIYNEALVDLLVSRAASGGGGGGGGGGGSGGTSSSKEGALSIREDPTNGVHVHGLSNVAVRSAAEVHSLMRKGDAARAVGATSMNDTSSRSHMIVSLRICQSVPIDADTCKEVRATLNLVDLAGSERAHKSGAEGAALKEGGSINKSLSALGMVVNALAEKSRVAATRPRSRQPRRPRAEEASSKEERSPKEGGKDSGGKDSGGKDSGGKEAASKPIHIPYRDSKLTRVLQDSLGGNSITVMLCAVSPNASEREETLNTLAFAERAKAITLKAQRNQITKESESKTAAMAAEAAAAAAEAAAARQEARRAKQQKMEERLQAKRAQIREAVLAERQTVLAERQANIRTAAAAPQAKHAPAPTRSKTALAGAGGRPGSRRAGGGGHEPAAGRPRRRSATPAVEPGFLQCRRDFGAMDWDIAALEAELAEVEAAEAEVEAEGVEEEDVLFARHYTPEEEGSPPSDPWSRGAIRSLGHTMDRAMRSMEERRSSGQAAELPLADAGLANAPPSDDELAQLHDGEEAEEGARELLESNLDTLDQEAEAEAEAAAEMEASAKFQASFRESEDKDRAALAAFLEREGALGAEQD